MEIVTTGGTFVCTGTLLNDSDDKTFIPYFLTAHHCLSLETEANDAEFYFDYRASTCDGCISVCAISSSPSPTNGSGTSGMAGCSGRWSVEFASTTS